MDTQMPKEKQLDRGGEKIATEQTCDVNERKKVAAYFDSLASYWDDIYRRRDVFSVIHQLRLLNVLGWVDQLELSADSRVLEVGCGAGMLTTALAQRGYSVMAMDSVQAMIDLTRNRVDEAGVARKVTTSLGDVHHLAFGDALFDVVLAIGVIPWLQEPEMAMHEFARVLRPGGYVIASADNRSRLHFLLDPAKSPYLAPARRAVKRILQAVTPRAKPRQTIARLHSIRDVDRMLSLAGLEKVAFKTLGFGPFSFLGREVLPSAWELKIHRRLQGWADRSIPIVRSVGAQYLVLARKRIGGDGPSDASALLSNRVV